MKNPFHTLLLIALPFIAACSGMQPTDTGIVTDGELRYRGGITDGLYDGYGVLTIGDSTAYSGQWKAGKRHGRGVTTDPQGRKVTALWACDTIVYGTMSDSMGTYRGEFDVQSTACGHGIYTGRDGSSYDGAWRNGLREGFGCGVTADGKVQVGEWKADVYRGERLTYTAERIYGIDISRYQHGKGRKKYAINWAKMRISHLGNISRKKVSGEVDYPVSFVYIKSTEGTTIRNPYYADDYRQARRHGIRCGAYHFFSPYTSAAKQAQYFLKHSRFAKGDMPAVLDVEPSASQIARMGGPEKMFEGIRTWLGMVHKRTGMRPILYVNQQFVNKYLPLAPDIMRDYYVWIARYGEYKPEVRLVFWQLCPDGRVEGIHGDVDINVFNGYHDRYNKFIEDNCLR